MDSVGTVAAGYFVEPWEVGSYSSEAFCVALEEVPEPSGIYRLSQLVRKSMDAVMRSAVNGTNIKEGFLWMSETIEARMK